MTYEIQQCSPKAAERIAATTTDVKQASGELHPRTVYPFELLSLGQCFAVPFCDSSERVLRNRISIQNKKDSRRFIVVKHTEFECYEVARIK